MTPDDLLDAFDAAWSAALHADGAVLPPELEDYTLPEGDPNAVRQRGQLREIDLEYRQRLERSTQADSGDAASGEPQLSFPTVPGFTLQAVIGRGAKGIVYRAVQHSLQRVVAVKTLSQEHAASPQDLERLRNEARVLGQLQHPNLVTVFSLEEPPHGLFLVMEYVEGGNLAETCRKRQLEFRESAGFLLAAARALQVAHESRVLHRDLKPSNILLDQSGMIRVTDFGLSRQDSLLPGNPSLTATVEVLGTPGYISPEQAAGRTRDLQATTDVYGLGATLFHLLTGRAPFVGETILDVLQQVQSNDPPALRLLNPAVPPALQTICLKCLSKNPADRYQTAIELADDLQRFLNGEPILARPQSQLRRGLRWCRRNPVTAALSTVVMFLLTVALFLLLDRSFRNAQELVDSETRNRILQASLTREKEASQLAYDSLVRRAVLEYETNNLSQLQQILNRTVPEDSATQKRSWEWRWLNGLLHRGLHEIELGETPAEWIGATAIRSDGTQFVVGTRVPVFQDRKPGTPAKLVVYDLKTGSPLRDLGPVLSILDLAYSEDDSVLYAVETDAGYDAVKNVYFGPGQVRRWETSDWTELPSIAQGPPIEHLALTPSNNQLLTVEANNGTTRHAHVWSLTGSDAKSTRVDDWRLANDFHGFVLRTAPGEEQRIPVTNHIQIRHFDRTQAGVELHTPTLALRSMFRPEESSGVTLEIRRRGSPDQYQTLPFASIEHLAVNSDEQQLAIASRKGEIQIWNMTDWTTTLTLRGHQTRVSCLAFSDNGQHLVSGDWSGNVIVWDLRRSASAVDSLPPYRGRAVETFAVLGDDRVLAQAVELPLQEFRIGEQQVVRQFDLPFAPKLMAPGRQVDLAEDGKWMVAEADKDPGVAEIRTVDTGELIQRFPRMNARISFTRIQDDLVTIAAWRPSDAQKSHHSHPAELQVYSREGHRLFSTIVPRSRVLRTAISDDRKLVSASVLTYLSDGSAENSVQTWSLSTGKLVDRIPMPGWVLAMEYSPAGELWAIDFSSGDLTIRDPVRNSTRMTRAGFGPEIQDLMFSPAENRLAGVSRSQVMLWNTETIRSVLALPLKTFESDFVFSPRVRFSNDGNRLFANQADGTIRMWDASD